MIPRGTEITFDLGQGPRRGVYIAQSGSLHMVATDKNVVAFTSKVWTDRRKPE